MSLAGFFGRLWGKLEVLGLPPWPSRLYQEWVEPGVLMRGSRLTDALLLRIREVDGIKSVVNLCLENDDDLDRLNRLGLYPGLRVEHFPVLDNDVLTPAQISFFLSWVEAPENRPTYVHCEAGVGRTGIAVACYRISRGWTVEQAIKEARAHGMALPEQQECIRQFAKRSAR